ALADAVMPADRPADWTAALMDIGASICHPRRPDCDACPLAGECRYALDRGKPRPTRAPRRAREVPVAYESTTRWLRGRIVERLRALPDGEWTAIEAPLGEHDSAAVETAVAGLAREGLLERDAAGRVRLPH
ncbi:MAG: A/G-specific adenine glycosylase, partial [Gaiellales bacterium]